MDAVDAILVCAVDSKGFVNKIWMHYNLYDNCNIIFIIGKFVFSPFTIPSSMVLFK